MSSPFHCGAWKRPGRLARLSPLLVSLCFASARPGQAAGTIFEHPVLEVGPAPVWVTVGDFDANRVPDLAVANLGSDDVSVHLGLGGGRYRPGIRFPAGGEPASVAVGDFNGDDVQDLAVANFRSDDVSILLGRGDGTFTVSRRLRADNGPFRLRVGDFDRDGVQDLAVSNHNSDDVSVHLGTGDGGFAPPALFLTGNEPLDLGVGDFNEDGAPDLAVATLFPSGVTVLVGNGDGTFRPEGRIPLGFIDDFAAVAVADLNADGHQDLAIAVAPEDPESSLHVFLGRGDGTFESGASLPAGEFPLSVDVGDFNGDGVPDLATADFASDTVSVFLVNGDGTFTESATVPAGGGPFSLDVDDLDSDGPLDLVVANLGGDDVWVILGEGDGTFRVNPARFPARGESFANDPWSMASGDLNRDGLADLAVANLAFDHSDISVLLGEQAGGFAPQSLFRVTGGLPTIAIEDVDGDEILDLVVSTWGAIQLDGTHVPAGVSILPGNGDGTFRSEIRLELPDDPFAVAVADLNTDGIRDLVASAGYVYVLLGLGGGTFAPPAFFSAGTATGTQDGIAVADFNGDGFEDVAVTNEAHFILPEDALTLPGTVSILLGRGDGTLGPHVRYGVGLIPQSVTVGDLNRDGVHDLIVANLGTDDISLLLGVGDGSFSQEKRFKVGVNPIFVEAADLDGDEIEDVVVANSGSNTISVLLGRGDGTFSRQSLFQAGHIPISLVVDDFNRDGRPDVATANPGSSDVTVLFNQGPPDWMRTGCPMRGIPAPTSIRTASGNQASQRTSAPRTTAPS